jgi:hypothetical protein
VATHSSIVSYFLLSSCNIYQPWACLDSRSALIVCFNGWSRSSQVVNFAICFFWLKTLPMSNRWHQSVVVEPNLAKARPFLWFLSISL